MPQIYPWAAVASVRLGTREWLRMSNSLVRLLRVSTGAVFSEGDGSSHREKRHDAEGKLVFVWLVSAGIPATWRVVMGFYFGKG